MEIKIEQIFATVQAAIFPSSVFRCYSYSDADSPCIEYSSLIVTEFSFDTADEIAATKKVLLHCRVSFPYTF